MEPEEPQAGLYDFLYKDAGRIASYYAQIFRGRLTSLEESDHEQENEERGSKLGVKIIEGNIRTLSQVQNSQKRIIDPHDVITTDVLSHLVEQGKLQTDLSAAANGEMAIVKGTVVFIDHLILETALIGFEEEIKQYKQRPKKDKDPQQVLLYEVAQKILSKFHLPSAFLLNTESGYLVGGVIKEASMEEAISSYYVKHGMNGLADVYLVAIKEQSTASFTLPAEQMFSVAQQIAQMFSQMLFPAEAIKVTPIALFRKL